MSDDRAGIFSNLSMTRANSYQKPKSTNSECEDKLHRLAQKIPEYGHMKY